MLSRKGKKGKTEKEKGREKERKLYKGLFCWGGVISPSLFFLYRAWYSMEYFHVLWRLWWVSWRRGSLLLAICELRMRRWLLVCSSWQAFMFGQSWLEWLSSLSRKKTRCYRVLRSFWLVLVKFQSWGASLCMKWASFLKYWQTPCLTGLPCSCLDLRFKWSETCCGWSVSTIFLLLSPAILNVVKLRLWKLKTCQKIVVFCKLLFFVCCC